MKKNIFISLCLLAVLWPVVDSCQTNTSGITTEKQPDSLYLTQGKKITGIAFSTLKHYLLQAMERGGTDSAIRFCQLHALPITDSLSKAHHVKIQRITHKPRNPENQASAEDMNYIQKYLSGELNQPVIAKKQYQTIYYQPIYVQPFCLTCHGTPEKNIPLSTYQIISEHYPNDKAINFEAGDFRGLWKITFENKN